MTYEQQVVHELEKYLRAKRAEVVAKSGSMKVNYKDDRSALTELDLQIEKDATDIIIGIDPSVGIFGEEYGIQGNKETFWTIDPIDGTEHFIRSIPEYMFMAGFIKEGVPTASVMYNFATDDLFVALPNQHSTKNGEKIYVSDKPKERSCIEVEVQDARKYEFAQQVENEFFASKSGFFRAGYGLMQVACGMIEARIQVNAYGKLYDFLPGFVLIKGAGGEVRNIGRQDWDYRDLNTIASNGIVADDLDRLVKELDDGK